MKTFLDYYNTKATLENDEKASNGEFTMYYTTKRKPRRVCASDRCFFTFAKGGDDRSRVLIKRWPNGGSWMRKPIHTIKCTHFGCFKPSELNTTVLTNTFMGITVYLNKEDAEKSLLPTSI